MRTSQVPRLITNTYVHIHLNLHSLSLCLSLSFFTCVCMCGYADETNEEKIEVNERCMSGKGFEDSLIVDDDRPRSKRLCRNETEQSPG